MGYILPVTHYSYINYGHRMRKSKESPHHIEKPFKVVFDITNAHVNVMDDRKKETNHFDETVRVKQYVKAQLTGKGRKVNVGI